MANKAGNNIRGHQKKVTVNVTVTSNVTVTVTRINSAILAVAVAAWEGGHDGQRCNRTAKPASASAVIMRR